MSYLWRCPCGATQWGGRQDGEDLSHKDWDDGDESCDHESAEIIDEEWEELGDEVI